MRVDFQRWPDVVDTYERWWAGNLGRPVAYLAVVDSPADIQRRIGPPPDLDYTRFTGCYAQDVDPADIVDRYDWELASVRYVADGFPTAWPNFGAGVLAALTGCRLVPREETIWFEPETLLGPAELSIAAGATSEVATRISAFYTAAIEYWSSAVQLGMTDLGGALDILQSFLPSERLALEIYDHPAEITRLIEEVHEAWWTFFDAFQSQIAETNRGYTAWTPLLSRKSYYMLQCDFAYMIGPDMFDEFVLPELTRSCAKLDRPFYHLDGEGQLAHLEKILAIPGLAGVQWIPGDGAPDVRHWPDVYRKIQNAGKLTQLFLDQCDGGLEILDVLHAQVGSLENVAVIGTVTAGAQEDAARRILARHGVPWAVEPG